MNKEILKYLDLKPNTDKYEFCLFGEDPMYWKNLNFAKESSAYMFLYRDGFYQAQMLDILNIEFKLQADNSYKCTKVINDLILIRNLLKRIEYMSLCGGESEALTELENIKLAIKDKIAALDSFNNTLLRAEIVADNEQLDIISKLKEAIEVKKNQLSNFSNNLGKEKKNVE